MIAALHEMIHGGHSTVIAAGKPAALGQGDQHSTLRIQLAFLGKGPQLSVCIITPSNCDGMPWIHGAQGLEGGERPEEL